MLILMVIIGQMAENWDTIGYRIEEFIYDEFDIDLNSIFDDSSSDEVNESNKNNESNENNWTDDWSETISAVKNGQEVTISVEGPDEEEASKKVKEFLETTL